MLQMNKQGNITVNAHNLEMMLYTFPQIKEDLVIAHFRGSDNKSIAFRGQVSDAAVSELRDALQNCGWLMHGAQRSVLYALSNAVFKLHAEGKLASVHCDYFDGEPKAAREWEGNSVDYFPASVGLDIPVVEQVSKPAISTEDLEKRTQQIIAATERNRKGAA